MVGKGTGAAHSLGQSTVTFAANSGPGSQVVSVTALSSSSQMFVSESTVAFSVTSDDASLNDYSLSSVTMRALDAGKSAQVAEAVKSYAWRIVLETQPSADFVITTSVTTEGGNHQPIFAAETAVALVETYPATVTIPIAFADNLIDEESTVFHLVASANPYGAGTMTVSLDLTINDDDTGISVSPSNSITLDSAVAGMIVDDS